MPGKDGSLFIVANNARGGENYDKSCVYNSQHSKNAVLQKGRFQAGNRKTGKLLQEKEDGREEKPSGEEVMNEPKTYACSMEGIGPLTSLFD